MLVRKKMSTRKLAIFIFIISFMIGGMGFMLFQNKRLTSVQPANNLPPGSNNLVPGAPALIPPDSPLGIGAVNNAGVDGPNQVLEMNKNNQGGVFNLNIFSSDKFKNLRANALIIKAAPAVGKRNPFKPN